MRKANDRPTGRSLKTLAPPWGYIRVRRHSQAFWRGILGHAGAKQVRNMWAPVCPSGPHLPDMRARA